MKILHCGKPRYLKEYIVPYTCPINTRRSNPDKQILHTTGYERKIHSLFQQLSHSFAYSVPRLWNDLPIEIRSAKTSLRLRKDLKTHRFVFTCIPNIISIWCSLCLPISFDKCNEFGLTHDLWLVPAS